MNFLNKKTINKCEVISRLIVRSKTNDNELCKQYFVIISSKGKNTALAIRKFILTDKNFDLYDKYGFQLLKIYKGYRLYKQVFSIKLSTLSEVIQFIHKTLIIINS